MKTYREFWVFSKQSELHSIEQGGFDNEDIYVIEHSAYDALAKENEELRLRFGPAEVGAVAGNVARPLLQEITSLRESLKLAVEAVSRCMFELDKCTNGHVIDPHRRDLAIEAYKYGRETLAKIKAKHGEL